MSLTTLGVGAGADGAGLNLPTPTAYWKLDEASNASTFVDQITSPAQCQMSVQGGGGTIQVAGLITSAVLPGTSTNLRNISTPTKMRPGSSIWHMGAWMKFGDATGSTTLIGNTPTNLLNGGFTLVSLGITAGKWQAQMSQSSQSIESVTITNTVINTWHLFMVWFDGANLNFNIDNGSIASVAASAGQLSIGWTLANINTVGGAQCESFFYNGSNLTSGQRGTVYNGGLGHTYTNGIGWT